MSGENSDYRNSSYLVRVGATHPRRSNPFYVVARISDGSLVSYPRDLTDWTGATTLGGLLRDGFTLTRDADVDEGGDSSSK